MPHVLTYIVDSSGWYAGYNAWDTDVNELPEKYGSLVLLNSPILFPGYLAYADRISWSEAREIVEAFREAGRPIESYIGHQSTAMLLTQELGIEVPVNRGNWQPSGRALALVFKLKKRTSGDVKEISKDDFEILLISYEEA